MLELQVNIPLSEKIKHIIESKNWYAFEADKVFSWKKSVALMAEMIGAEFGIVETNKIKEIIEGSFTQESLSKTKEECFIDGLLKIDSNLILWSEGDPAWQKLKATNTGLLDRQGFRAEFISKEKTAKLKELILSLAKESGEKVCVIVIDDKLKNLNFASSLQNELIGTGVIISTFLLSLSSIEANPDACLKFISEIQKEMENVRIIVDMDGVIVNTDGVLKDVVPKKIADLISNDL